MEHSLTSRLKQLPGGRFRVHLRGGQEEEGICGDEARCAFTHRVHTRLNTHQVDGIHAG